MGESRIKRGKPRGFFALYRSAAQDARLSLAARGLFSLMMSLPDEWEFTVSGLAALAGCGKDKIRKLLGELEEVGYLLREQSHDKGGRFSGNNYVLQDEAPLPLSGKPDNGEEEKSPLSENTDDGEHRQRETPSTENPTQRDNINIINNPPTPQGGEGQTESKPKRKRAPKAVPDWQPEKFEGFWAAYPRDEDRAKAAEQWDAIGRDKALLAAHGGDEGKLLREIARGLQRHLECEDWKKSVGIPYAFRWLRDRKWTEKQKVGSLNAPTFVPTSRTFRTLMDNGEEVVSFGP